MSIPAGQRSDVQRNRAAILQAAIDVLAVRPAASMQEVASEAGLNRATLYRHFQDRDQLIRAVYLAALADIRILTDRFPDAGPVLPVLGDYLEAGIELGNRYRILVVAPPSGPEFVELELEAAAPVFTLLHRGQDQGEVDPRLTVEFLASLLTTQVIGAVALVMRGMATIEEATGQARLAFLKAVRPESN